MADSNGARVVADVTTHHDTNTAGVADRLGLAPSSALSWLQQAEQDGHVQSRPARAGLRWSVTGELLATVPSTTTIPNNLWGRLALHMVDVHADPTAIYADHSTNLERHDRDHTGPGAAPGHNRNLREFSLRAARSAIAGHLALEWELDGG